MSKTDKTKPWRVKEQDEALTFEHVQIGFPIARWPRWWIGAVRCPCPQCRGKIQARRKIKKMRSEGKRQAREES